MKLRLFVSLLLTLAVCPMLLPHASALQQSPAGSYVNRDNSAEYLELKPDGSFHLRERGRDFAGRYKLDGELLLLQVGRTVARGKLQGDTVRDAEGKVWVRRTDSLASRDGAPPVAGLGLKDAEFVVKLMSPISTTTSQKGDRFTAQVISPEQYAGAVVEGKINNVKKAKIGGEKSEVAFGFETITVGSNTYPIAADLKEVANSKGVKEVDEEGRAIGRTSNKKRAASVLAGSGAGAIIGGLAGGRKGAGIGAAAGAAAGLLIGVKFTTAGADMEFAPGSQFTLLVSDHERR